MKLKKGFLIYLIIQTSFLFYMLFSQLWEVYCLMYMKVIRKPCKIFTRFVITWNLKGTQWKFDLIFYWFHENSSISSKFHTHIHVRNWIVWGHLATLGCVHVHCVGNDDLLKETHLITYPLDSAQMGYVRVNNVLIQAPFSWKIQSTLLLFLFFFKKIFS